MKMYMKSNMRSKEISNPIPNAIAYTVIRNFLLSKEFEESRKEYCIAKLDKNQINQIISGQSELGEELTTAIRQTKKSVVLEAQRAEEAEAKLTVEADRISAEVSGKLDTESGYESFG